MVDWQVVATIAGPVITLFIGVWVNHRFESRPVLLSYFSHVGAFTHRPPQGQPIGIHTHSVVLRNAGRRSATNVRIRHNTLPEFNIWPNLGHTVEDLPGGSREILIPTLIPGEEITISYLYFPPLTVAEINAGIKCDQGFAQAIPVLLQRQFPKWFNFTAGLLLLVGLVTVLYLAYGAALFLVRR